MARLLTENISDDCFEVLCKPNLLITAGATVKANEDLFDLGDLLSIRGWVPARLELKELLRFLAHLPIVVVLRTLLLLLLVADTLAWMLLRDVSTQALRLVELTVAVLAGKQRSSWFGLGSAGELLGVEELSEVECAFLCLADDLHIELRNFDNRIHFLGCFHVFISVAACGRFIELSGQVSGHAVEVLWLLRGLCEMGLR